MDSEESKKNIFLRVPFLEFSALQTSVMPVPSVESDDPMCLMAKMMQDTVAWTEQVKSPRIIKARGPCPASMPPLCKQTAVIFSKIVNK